MPIGSPRTPFAPIGWRPCAPRARAPVVAGRGGALPRWAPRAPLTPPSPSAAPSRCRSDQFQCAPGAPCFPQDWRCDGHPDCEDDGDEWGCGTATAAEPSAGSPAVTPPRSSAVPPSGSAGMDGGAGGGRRAGPKPLFPAVSGRSETAARRCECRKRYRGRAPSASSGGADPKPLRSPRVAVSAGSAVGDAHLQLPLLGTAMSPRGAPSGRAFEVFPSFFRTCNSRTLESLHLPNSSDPWGRGRLKGRG